MDNSIESKNLDFDITKNENKIINCLSEINKHFSLLLFNLLHENISKDDKLKIDINLSHIMKKINKIQLEIEKLKDNITSIKELIIRL